MKLVPRVSKVGTVCLFALISLAACVAGPYEGGVSVGYVGGFYAPGGYEYGGWGPGYRVGPPRGGARGVGGRAPSIPSGPRGGAGHPGGRGR
jgi:hypothetical protein